MTERCVYWIKQEKADIPQSLDWLHDSEMKVLAGLKFEKRRLDWLLGRWTAKNAVRLFSKVHDLSIPEVLISEIEICAAENGAPEVFYHSKRIPVVISISHSNGIGLCAINISPFKIGCDAEIIEARTPLFLQDYFKESEKDFIKSQETSDKDLWINLIWSIKEATLKAKRTGLRIDPLRVEVEFPIDLIDNDWKPVRTSLLESKEVFWGYWRQCKKMIYTFSSDAQFKIVELSL